MREEGVHVRMDGEGTGEGESDRGNGIRNDRGTEGEGMLGVGAEVEEST